MGGDPGRAHYRAVLQRDRVTVTAVHADRPADVIEIEPRSRTEGRPPEPIAVRSVNYHERPARTSALDAPPFGDVRTPTDREDALGRRETGPEVRVASIEPLPEAHREPEWSLPMPHVPRR